MAERSRSRERRRDGNGLVDKTPADEPGDFLAELFGEPGKEHALNETVNFSVNHLGELRKVNTLDESFEVPNKYLGLLIGKHGDTIRKMREQAAVKGVKIFVDSYPNSSGHVKLTGNSMQAIQEIKARLRGHLIEKSGFIRKEYKLETHDLADNFLVPRNLYGLLIGNQGCAIRKLRMQADVMGVEINVPYIESNDKIHDISVKLTGNSS